MDKLSYILPNLRALLPKREKGYFASQFERLFESGVRFPMSFPRALSVAAAALGCLMATAASTHAGAGFFKEFVIINRGSGNEYFGNPLGSGFNGQNLTSGRTWYEGDSAPVLNGAEANTYQDNGDWVSNVRLLYIINSSAGAGSFTTVTLDERSSSGNNKMWDQTTQSISLAARSPGTYGVEVYFQAQGNWSGGNWQFYNSASPNYRATFTITALNAPSGQSAATDAASGHNEIDLAWTRGTSGSAKDTIILRKTSAITTAPSDGTPYSVGNTIDGATVVYKGSGTSFADTGLSANTRYYYAFYALNGNYYSSGVTADTTTAPAVPSSVSGNNSVTSSGFTVSWAASTGATSYRLDVDDNSDFSSPLAGYTNLSVNGTSQAVSGLAANTTYYIRVRAVNATGTSSSSSSVSQLTAPATPSTPSASSVSTAGFTVSWSAVTGATSYRLDVDNNSDFSSPEAGYNNLTVNTASQAVSGLSAGTTYYVRVRAVNAGGTSASSSTLTQATSAATATISSSGTPAALSTTYGTASTSTSFSVSGTSMAQGILVTPPSGFEVSTNNSTFSSTVTVGAAGTIASTTVYVRLSATAVPASYSGNIVLSSSGAANVNVATTSSTVNTKALTVSSAAVTSKVYDRTTSATITGTLNGVNGSDVVTLSGTGTFASANVGTGISVTSTSTLGGANASYYTLTQPTGLTGNITAAPLTITGASAANKTYDRTTSITVTGGSLSGVLSGDTVTLSAASAAGTVASAAVGTGKAVTVTGYSISGTHAGNYSLSQPTGLTANITAKALTITGASATNRAYNATTAVAVSGGSLSGVISGDSVTLGGSPSGSVASATVGDTKTVTVTGYSISGADSSNYSLTQPTGLTVNITKATPTVSVNPAASGIRYGRPLSASTFSGGTVSPSGGTWAWTSPSTIPAPGTAAYSATFTPTDTTNYNNATANVSLTVTIAQSRNTGGSTTPNQPSAVYLGDTNRTFGAETWGDIDGDWGRGRLFIRHSNSNLVGGISTDWGAPTNVNAKTFSSPQFTNTGTWYWGIQMDYGGNYGTNFWHKISTNNWTDMSTNGDASSLSVTVQALPTPSGISFSGVTASQMTLNWTKATNATAPDGYDVLVLQHTNSGFTEEPVQGTRYTNGQTIGGATVLYRGGTNSLSVTGLTAGTTYYYKLYSENWNYYSAAVATNAATPGTPTITIGGNAANATATAFSTTYGSPSTAQTFTIAGTSLTANITATAPTGFEVSSDGSSYGSTATFTQSGGSASGTLHVRLASTAAANGTYNSQNITLASTGATTRNISTTSSGNTVTKATPTVTTAPTASASIIKGDKLFNGLLTGGAASTAGTFTFNDTTSEQTASGNKAVTFTPTDTTNFNTVSANVNVTVVDVPDPTNVSATASGTTSIALTHDLTSSKNVMIVRRAGSAVTFTPADDTTYSDGQDVGSGHTVVRGSLAANSSSDTGLTPSTTYHYKIFSENWGWYSPGVTASATTSTPPPSISVSGSPAAMSTDYGTASSPNSFTVSGSNLSANLTVTAPSGFEVSTTAGSGYAASVSLTPSSGTVGSTTIYIRLAANAAPGSNSGNVTAASTGATSQTVAVSGTVNVPSMSMSIASPAGTMDANYTTSKLYADEVSGTTNNVTITFNTGNSNAAEVEVWTNLNNRDRADDDANNDGIPDGIIPPDPPTDKPSGYTSGVYPSNGYFQAHPMSGSGGTYTLTLNANKTGAYRLTARYRVNGGPWVWYNLGGKRDHAITVAPVLARQMQVYEINVLNINATGDTFQTRSTFEDLTDTNSTRVNLDYLRNLGVNTLWFQPIHPNGVEGREPSGGWNTETAPYDPGSPYAVKNFFEVMEIMTDNYNGGSSVSANRAAAMSAFTNFVTAADAKGVHVMLDAPFNHTAHDVELSPKGLELLAAAGVSTNGWSATDKIKDREARFFSRNDGSNAYAGPASSAANVAVAPDRNDFGKWRDVLDVFFGRYSSLVEGNPSGGAALSKYKNEEDTMNYADLTGGANSAGAVTRAVWQYFAKYVPHWLEKTGLPAGSSPEEQATKGVDGLRADFGQGMPPQFWEYVINVAREHKWSFVFMSESLDGGEVTYRSNRHFDILNENIVFPLQNANTVSAVNRDDEGNLIDGYREIFERRRDDYGLGLVLLNNTSHDEAGYADPWQAFIRYAVGSTIDGAPMIMYGQEIGTGASLSFNHYELNFGKSIPHFKRYNSMQPQWTAWQNNDLGVRNLMPAYSGVGLAREFSPALRSANRSFLNVVNSLDPDQRIYAVAKWETTGASPSSSDVVLAFVNLDKSNNVANTFGISSGLAGDLGLESNKRYNVRNIAAYLGPNNEYPNRRSQFLWETPRTGADIVQNGIYVALNGVPTTDAGWVTNPHEAQYLKVYAAPSVTTSGTPAAVSTTYGTASANTSFTFSASDVHDGVTITAPAGFQVSTNASTGFAGSLSLTNTGTIGSTTVYARLAATNPVGSYSGNITFSSPGGTNTTVALPASSVTAKALTITGATATSRAFDGSTTVAITGGTLSGAVGADDVTLGGSPTGSIADANAGTGKAVTVTGYTISGSAAGNYTLTQPTDVTVNITKATPTITAAPTAAAITEGQALSASVLSGGTASVGGTFAFTSPNTVPAVGTANQSVTFTPTDTTNYNTATTTVSMTVNSAAAALPGNATVDFIDGNYVIVDAEGNPLVGATYTYSYAGRSVGGLTETYAFLSYSSASAPTAPGFYTVTVTAGGAYTGSLQDELAIAGPLALPAGEAIEPTKIAGATTVRFNRTTLLGTLQRVTSEGTLATGATGLSWTGVTAGLSQMPPGSEQLTMTNTVTHSSSFVTLTPPGSGASTSDSFTVTVSDGVTPVTYPVTVTSTAAPAFDLVIRKVVPIDGDTNNMRAIFLTRPNRTVELEFFTESGFVPVRDKETVVSADTQNSLTTTNGVTRPPDKISTGSAGVVELKVPAGQSSMSFRAKPVIVPQQ